MLELVSTVPDWTWILTVVIALVTLISVRHILQVRSLPPGPFPLPILGNILALRGEGNELMRVISRLEKKHKGMFTLWLGHKPTIIISDWELCHEGLITKRNDFSGRVMRGSGDIICSGNDDVVFTDFGPSWETLRKILSAAVRKYAVSDQLAELVSEVVDKTSEEMLKDGNPVEASGFMYLIIYNVLASSAFGKRFEINDPDFIRLRKNNDDVNETLGTGLPSDALPFLKWFYRKRIQKLQHLAENLSSYVKGNLNEHQETFQASDIRDFTDAILAAREEAEAEGKESLQYLTEGNMINVLTNLFAAGTDTTRILLLWIFLLSCDQPNIIKRMQQEIDQNIGSRSPRQTDKNLLPFVQAVITETLRFNPVLDITLEHKAVFDTELGGYKIPKNTSCLFYIRGHHYNTEFWEEPERFNPDRFLDSDGKFSKTRLSGYMPFGLGRRGCPGEKLALADSFLIVVRLLQKYDFDLEGGPGSVVLSPDYKSLGNFPAPFKLVLTKRN